MEIIQFQSMQMYENVKALDLKKIEIFWGFLLCF